MLNNKHNAQKNISVERSDWAQDLLNLLLISCRFDSRLPKEEALMIELFLLSKAQMARISPHFPLAHGVPRVDVRRVVSGIVYVIRNGLQ